MTAYTKPICFAVASAILITSCAQNASTGLPALPPQPSPTIILSASPTTGPFASVIQVNNPVIMTLTPSPTLPQPTSTPLAVGSGAIAPQTPTPTITDKNQTNVKIYMVAINDNGKAGKKIGCDDSLVAVDRSLKRTQAVLGAALSELFAVKTQNYGASGLYNSLYQSDLQLKSAQNVNGRMIVHLSGTYKLGGACDVPRFKEQISATVRQFSTTQNAAIYLNGVPIEQVR